MIAHWPKGIKKNVGKTTPEIGHVMDIMATCIDMAGATYPTKYKGNDIIPLRVRVWFLSSRPDIVKDMTTLDSNITMNVHSSLMTVGNWFVREKTLNGNYTT